MGRLKLSRWGSNDTHSHIPHMQCTVRNIVTSRATNASAALLNLRPEIAEETSAQFVPRWCGTTRTNQIRPIHANGIDGLFACRWLRHKATSRMSALLH